MRVGLVKKLSKVCHGHQDVSLGKGKPGGSMCWGFSPRGDDFEGGIGIFLFPQMPMQSVCSDCQALVAAILLCCLSMSMWMIAIKVVILDPHNQLWCTGTGATSADN